MLVRRAVSLILIVSLAFPLSGCSESKLSSTSPIVESPAPSGPYFGFVSFDKAGGGGPVVPTMGELHNDVLKEAIDSAIAKGEPITIEVMKAEIETAVRSILGNDIPADYDLAAVIDAACLAMPEDTENIYDLSDIFSDSGQRAWAEGLVAVIDDLETSEDVKLAVINYGMANGLPTAEPLVSFVDVILHSSELWLDYSVTKRDGAVYAADGAGVIRGGLMGMIGGTIGVIIGGAVYGGLYSWMMATAIGGDN